MSNPDPNKVIFSSRYRYFLNKPRLTNSVSVPSASISAGGYSQHNLSIPINDQADFSQIKINFSHNPGDWHVFPCLDVVLDTNCSISITGSYSTTALNITIYVSNQTAGSVNNTAFTATARVHPFEPPA